MTTQCTLYTFRADDAPHGIIQVARLTTRQSTHEYARDIMVDFPEQYLRDNPICNELMGMAAVALVDDRDIDNQVDTLMTRLRRMTHKYQRNGND